MRLHSVVSHPQVRLVSSSVVRLFSVGGAVLLFVRIPRAENIRRLCFVDRFVHSTEYSFPSSSKHWTVARLCMVGYLCVGVCVNVVCL